MPKNDVLCQAVLRLSLSVGMAYSLFHPLPLWAQEAQHNDATIEFYRRKHIALYDQNPELPFNAIFVERFQALLPRLRFFELGHHGSTNFAEFLIQARRFHQAQAGALAEADTAPSFNYDARVVTWSDTQAVARAAFAFRCDWQFQPIELEGLERSTIEPDKKGNSRPDKIPEGAYYQSRDVDVEITDEDTGEKKTVTRTAYDYWHVRSGTRLDFALDMYSLENKTPAYYAEENQSWGFSDTTLVTRTDIAQLAQELDDIDLDDSETEEALLELARFQALTQQDPLQVYGSRAQMRLSSDPFWPSALADWLKKQDEFKLKTQLVQSTAQHLWADFGDAENAGELGVLRRDWYELLEYRQSENGIQSQSLGYAKVRGFADGQALFSELSFKRPAELGDQMVEYPGHQVQWGLGAGIQFIAPDLGPSLMTRVAWPIDRHDAHWFNQQLATLQTPQKQERAQALAHNWEHDWYVELNGSILGSQPYGEFQTGWWARHYWGPWYFSGGLAPGLGLLFTEDNGQEDLAGRASINAIFGLGYQFNPGWSLNAESQWSVYFPAAWGAQLRIFGSYAF